MSVKFMRRCRRLLLDSIQADDDVLMDVSFRCNPTTTRIDVHLPPNLSICLQSLCERSKNSHATFTSGRRPETTVCGRFFGRDVIWVFHQRCAAPTYQPGVN